MNKLERWLTAWADLASNITEILTFAYYRPLWGTRLMLRLLQRKSREEAQEQPTPWGL